MNNAMIKIWNIFNRNRCLVIIIICIFAISLSGVLYTKILIDGEQHSQNYLDMFDPKYFSIESFRFEKFNNIILAPAKVFKERTSISKIMTLVFKHLFPLGTPLRKLDDFMKAQASLPEVASKDYLLRPKNRLDIRESPGVKIYFYNFKFNNELLADLASRSENDIDKSKYTNLMMTMMSWKIIAEIDNNDNLLEIIVELDALAP